MISQAGSPTELPTRALPEVGGFNMKIHLLKASHHGRKSGYHREIVKAMNPDVTILSVGDLKAKDDGAASCERYSVEGCYSTLDHGDIIARLCFAKKCRATLRSTNDATGLQHCFLSGSQHP